jgi:dual specificity MAP kinase phosphatase
LRYCRVTPQIYVGAQIGAAGKRRLLARGFTASVNLRREFDDAAHGLALAQYCYLPTDDEYAPTLTQLETGVAFIRSVLENGGKVYIHCHGGIGRAPTLAAAYFMRQGYSLEAALALIRTVRPFIRPTPEQLEQLKRFGEVN